MRKADQDATGKRVGSKQHDTLIKAVEMLADLSRIRRARYGSLWLDCAQQCIAPRREVHKSGHSPTRNRSYFFHARHNLDFNEEKLLVIAAEKLASDNTSLVVGLSATAENIIHTYESIRSSMNGTLF